LKVAHIILALALGVGACASPPRATAPLGDYVAVLHPGGPGPYAAIVLVPGCDGVRAHIDDAARRFLEAGFLTYVYDYPRRFRFDAACANLDVAALGRDIATLARGGPGPAPVRVHAVGWAQGGAATMEAIARHPDTFTSAAAFYPDCARITNWSVPVPFLLLLGAEDKWMPGERCSQLAERAPGAARVLAIRYGGAGHGFDAATPVARGWRPWSASATERFDAQVRDGAWLDLKIFFDVVQ
jgi:dienelactone hydrolase